MAWGVPSVLVMRWSAFSVAQTNALSACGVPLAAAPDCPAKLPATTGLSRVGDLDVAAGVILVPVRVQDVADRLVPGDLADRGEELVRQRLQQRVDDEHAVVTDREGGVELTGGGHVDVALDVQRLHLNVVEVRGAALTAARRLPRRAGAALASRGLLRRSGLHQIGDGQ